MPAPLSKRDEAARCEALRRVLRLYVALTVPRSLHSLAMELRVSPRTVRRDMDVLRGVGVLIWRNETSGHWRMSHGGILSQLARSEASSLLSEPQP